MLWAACWPCTRAAARNFERRCPDRFFSVKPQFRIVIKLHRTTRRLQRAGRKLEHSRISCLIVWPCVKARLTGSNLSQYVFINPVFWTILAEPSFKIVWCVGNLLRGRGGICRSRSVRRRWCSCQKYDNHPDRHDQPDNMHTAFIIQKRSNEL